MPPITRPADVKLLRKAAQAAGAITDALIQAIQPGGNAAELEELANQLLAQNRSTAPFKSFEDGGKRFGHACCVSINADVVNGLPTADHVFATGDMVSVAIATNIRGIHGKAARTVVVGNNPSPQQANLIKASRQLFDELQAGDFKPSVAGELSVRINSIAAQAGVVPIDDTGGHGIGKQHQQDMALTNTPEEAEQAYLDSLNLVHGMAIVPMPMFAIMDTPDAAATTEIADDSWTMVLTSPGIATHWADTCWVNDDGVLEVLSAAQ